MYNNREKIKIFPTISLFIRSWRSWISQQIPILKDGGSNPSERAKTNKPRPGFKLRRSFNFYSQNILLFLIYAFIQVLYI